jgi:hypothetical protein
MSTILIAPAACLHIDIHSQSSNVHAVTMRYIPSEHIQIPKPDLRATVSFLRPSSNEGQSYLIICKREDFSKRSIDV